MNTKELIQMTELLQTEAFATFSVIPGSVFHKNSDSSILMSGVNAALLNGIFDIRWNEKTALKNLQFYKKEFQQKNLPFMVHVFPHSSPYNLEVILQNEGFEKQSESTLFAVDLKSINSLKELPKQYKIRQLSSQNDVYDYINVFRIGFELPEVFEKAFSDYFTHYGFGQEKPMQSLILSENNKPLAIMSILKTTNENSPEYCTMMNLSVIPEARRRGLGAILASEGVRLTLKRGCTHLCTTGTPQGMLLYKKIHPQEIGKSSRWVLK
jgi:ribosomal protein S18 acetylase RimI-like enzyme